MSDSAAEKRPFDNSLGVLGGCLVDGDSAELSRANRQRRKALALSVLMETLALALIILFPLIWAGERIAIAGSPPQPIYLGGGAPRPQRTPRPERTHPHLFCVTCPTGSIRPIGNIPNHLSQRDLENIEEIGDAAGPFIPGIPGGTGVRAAAPPPPPPVQGPRRISGPISQAAIVFRVEPVYPALPLQMHRSGRVELHAIISTDGTIQSLEVVSGDPLFYASALNAVRQWRYRPTLLNGQAVEVDTVITVIYRVQ